MTRYLTDRVARPVQCHTTTSSRSYIMPLRLRRVYTAINVFVLHAGDDNRRR